MENPHTVERTRVAVDVDTHRQRDSAEVALA